MPRSNRPRRLFVSTQWLADHLDAPDLVVFDASWHMPAAGRDARAEYLAGHIPGAVFFDIDGVADHSTNLPHMLPGPGLLRGDAPARLRRRDAGRRLRQPRPVLGAAPVVDAARLRRRGRLDPGGRPCPPGKPRAARSKRARRREPPRTSRRASTMPRRRRGRREMRAPTIAPQVVDARPAARFLGLAPEPRPGLRRATCPAPAICPSAIVEDGRLKDTGRLEAEFAAAGVDPGNAGDRELRLGA